MQPYFSKEHLYLIFSDLSKYFIVLKKATLSKRNTIAITAFIGSYNMIFIGYLIFDYQSNIERHSKIFDDKKAKIQKEFHTIDKKVSSLQKYLRSQKSKDLIHIKNYLRLINTSDTTVLYEISLFYKNYKISGHKISKQDNGQVREYLESLPKRIPEENIIYYEANSNDFPIIVALSLGSIERTLNLERNSVMFLKGGQNEKNSRAIQQIGNLGSIALKGSAEGSFLKYVRNNILSWVSLNLIMLINIVFSILLVFWVYKKSKPQLFEYLKLVEKYKGINKRTAQEYENTKELYRLYVKKHNYVLGLISDIFKIQSSKIEKINALTAFMENSHELESFIDSSEQDRLVYEIRQACMECTYIHSHIEDWEGQDILEVIHEVVEALKWDQIKNGVNIKINSGSQKVRHLTKE